MRSFHFNRSQGIYSMHVVISNTCQEMCVIEDSDGTRSVVNSFFYELLNWLSCNGSSKDSSFEENCYKTSVGVIVEEDGSIDGSVRVFHFHPSRESDAALFAVRFG